MPVGWYIVPYKHKAKRFWTGSPLRYCEIDDYTQQILASGGRWTETEILGNRAIVKLRASQAILNQADALYKRLPKDRLDDPLSDLSVAIRQALKNEVLDQGYTIEEVQARFGDDLGSYTLRQVLTFMASRRKKPRYDSQADEIVFDGPDQPCRPIEEVDSEVTE